MIIKRWILLLVQKFKDKIFLPFIESKENGLICIFDNAFHCSSSLLQCDGAKVCCNTGY